MNTILWEVSYSSSPKAIHYCKKCGTKTEHLSSDLFRVNAQQKSLDIWLIYRCSHCKSTWNLPLHSRINPKTLTKDLLAKFTNNERELAMQYAMDPNLLKQNGGDLLLPPYQIIGEVPDFSHDVCIHITSKYPSKLKVSKILKEKLELSNKIFEALATKGILRMENEQDIGKCRLESKAAVQLFARS